MAALVLGFLTASAKSSYDTRRSELTQIAANVILIDRVMAHYGKPVNCSAGRLPTRSIKFGQRVVPHLRLQAQALRITADLGHMRWLLFEQRGRSIPILFLVILVFWLAIIFVSFGLFAPQNATVVATLLLCALSVSGVIFLILRNEPALGSAQDQADCKQYAADPFALCGGGAIT